MVDGNNLLLVVEHAKLSTALCDNTSGKHIMTSIIGSHQNSTRDNINGSDGTTRFLIAKQLKLLRPKGLAVPFVYTTFSEDLWKL